MQAHKANVVVPADQYTLCYLLYQFVALIDTLSALNVVVLWVGDDRQAVIGWPHFLHAPSPLETNDNLSISQFVELWRCSATVDAVC